MKTQMRILLAVMIVSLPVIGVAAVDSGKLLNSIDALKSYQYGQAGGVDLAWVEREVAMASKDAQVRADVEQGLIDALAAATTNDAKQFFCRQLRTIGTARAVPQLESMLTDPDISHMARYALGRIEAPEAGQALHRALGQTSGKIKAGLINTLVKAGYNPAASDITALIGDSDKDVAVAAIKATGHFGGRGAVRALRQARSSATPEVQMEIDGALLNRAEQLAQAGDNRRAARIYQEYYTGDYSEQLRVAGLRGLTVTRGEEAAGLLAEAIKGDDADLRRNAIGMMALIKGQKTTDTFVALSKSLPADGQELIVRSLAARGDVSAAPAVIDMTASTHENVRLAALEALGDIGTPSAIAHLAKAAATAGDRERQIARASLVRMRGTGIDNAFIRAVNAGDADSRTEIIRAVGQRGSNEAFAALRKVAETEAEASVRREAILSMGRVGMPADLEILLNLIVAPKEGADRSTLERAVVILFGKIVDRDAQAEPVIATLKNAPVEARPVLVNLLVRPATSQALDAVRSAAESSNSTVSDAAIRALGQWPDAAPTGDLYRIASTSNNPTHKILALRGYIRLAPLTRNPMAAYVKAMNVADRKDEIRLVLGGLQHAGSLEALEMAEKYMADETLKAEAYMAAVKVANVYSWRDEARARTTLDKVIAEAPSDSIRNQAREVIKTMERYRGLIGAWKGAGPYMIDGVNDGRRVFDTPFLPETDPDAAAITWRIILPEFEGDSRINLEKTYGGIDYCSAYLRTTIYSTCEQTGQIRWAVDDYIKAWLNGRPVSQEVKLRQGANDFMIKVGDHGGGWNFSCGIYQPDGTPLEGVTFEPE